MITTATTERFLVTGSDGCIGSWVIHNLVKGGHEAVGFDLRATGERLARLLGPDEAAQVQMVAGDLTKDGEAAAAIERHSITRVVHLAALQIPFVASDPIRGADVNVGGTVRVFEAVRQSAGVRGLAYASSGAVFGRASRDDPDSLYGVFKRCNEASARRYLEDWGVSSVGLRPCVVYGPNRDQGLTSAVTSAIKAAAAGESFHIPFGGVVDLEYTSDVADAFISASLAGIEGAPVIDLHGDTLSVADVVETITSVVPDSEGKITHGDDELLGELIYDDESLTAVLGPLSKTTLRDGIIATADFFASRGDEQATEGASSST